MASLQLPPITPAGKRWQRDLRIPDEHFARVLAGEDRLLFDGGMGTQLQERGLAAGDVPELLCLTDPEEITAVHAAYIAAGSEAITTNTFGANRLKLAEGAQAAGVETPSVDEIFRAAIACARAAGARYVAADIGPTGALLQPMGTLSFDDAYELFAEQAIAAETHGADLVIIETMADLAEAKAALLAVRENTSLPAFVTMTFGEDGRTFLGTTPEVAAVTLNALGAQAVGINCSLGPADVAPMIARVARCSRVPVMAQANAGLPHIVDGRTVYSIGPEEYCESVATMLASGITIVGGCCGTTPAHIAGEKALLERLAEPALPARPELPQAPLTVASAQRLVELPAGHVAVIGERINPTGKKRLAEALRTGNLDYVLLEAIHQDEAGAEILDVNAGLPEIDETAVLCRLMQAIPGVTTCPLQVDSADPVAIEAAVRSYAGKPIINSCNGKAEVLREVVPIAKHYGCALVGLTISEEGIPPTAEGRLAVAQRIVEAADAAGIPREDVLIDCLTMAVSTDQAAGQAILRAIRLVKQELPGVRTVLGVSNISFGLPYRELLNATFLTAAFAAGLDLAIMNPLSQRFMDAVAAWRVFNGQDKNENNYVQVYAERAAAEKQAKAAGVLTPEAEASIQQAASALKVLAQQTGVVIPFDGAGATSQLGGVGASAQPSVILSGAEGSRALGNGPLPQPTGLEAEIHGYVLAGRADPVGPAVTKLLESADPMHVIDDVLIPALDEVGEKFEAGTFFLPQLMASAEAAKAGFEAIRATNQGSVASKGKIAIATVKGDIHDIGKNIVRMLLENYGYDVLDLGRDCDPQYFANTVVEQHIELAGLSALMTTTVPAMAETIGLLREQAPWCKVMVGGAVLNPEYAQMVGADFYAKDANESARIAAEVLG